MRDGGDITEHVRHKVIPEIYYPPKWRPETHPMHDVQHFWHGESQECARSHGSASSLGSRKKRLRMGLEADLKAQKRRAKKRQIANKNNNRIKSQLEFERIKRERRKAEEEAIRAKLAEEEEKRLRLANYEIARKKREQELAERRARATKAGALARQKSQRLKEALKAKEVARVKREAKIVAARQKVEAKAAARAARRKAAEEKKTTHKKAAIWACFGRQAVDESKEEESVVVRAAPALMELESGRSSYIEEIVGESEYIEEVLEDSALPLSTGEGLPNSDDVIEEVVYEDSDGNLVIESEDFLFDDDDNDIIFEDKSEEFPLSLGDELQKLSAQEALRKEEEEARRLEKQATRDVLTAMLMARPLERSESSGPVQIKKKRVSNVLDKEIGFRSPTLLGMIANAKNELRPPVPEDHKEEYVPLLEDVTTMGRFNRLPENVIEAYGKRSAEEFNKAKTDSSYADWELNHAARGQDRTPVIARNRTETQIMINEAAAVGKMMTRLQERYSYFDHAPEETEIDDLGDAKHDGAKVFRTEHLIDRHLKLERQVDWTPDYDDVEYETLDEVTLPSLEQPRFKPKRMSKSGRQIRDDLSQQVAEGYWRRYDRLERPGAKLIVTQGCYCRYCKSANTWQTYAYQKKWADERLPPKDELDDNPDPEKFGYIQRLYLSKAVKCEEINIIHDDFASDVDNENHKLSFDGACSVDFPEDLDRVDESEDEESIETPANLASEASMLSSLSSVMPPILEQETVDVNEALEELETNSQGDSVQKCAGKPKLGGEDDLVLSTIPPLTELTVSKRTSTNMGGTVDDTVSRMTTQSVPVSSPRREDDLKGSKMNSSRSLENHQKPRKFRPLKWMRRVFLGHSNKKSYETERLNSEQVSSTPEPVIAITGSAGASNMEMVDSSREESHPRSSGLTSSSSEPADEQAVTSLQTQSVKEEAEEGLIISRSQKEETKIKGGMKASKFGSETKVEEVEKGLITFSRQKKDRKIQNESEGTHLAIETNVERTISKPIISDESDALIGDVAPLQRRKSMISEESAALLGEMAKMYGPGKRKSSRRVSSHIRTSASMLHQRKSMLRDPSVLTLKTQALSVDELMFGSDEDILARTIVPEHGSSSQDNGNAKPEEIDNSFSVRKSMSTKNDDGKSISFKKATEGSPPRFNRSASLLSQRGVQSFRQSSPARDLQKQRPHLNRYASATSLNTAGMSSTKLGNEYSAPWIKQTSVGETTASSPATASWASPTNSRTTNSSRMNFNQYSSTSFIERKGRHSISSVLPTSKTNEGIPKLRPVLSRYASASLINGDSAFSGQDKTPTPRAKRASLNISSTDALRAVGSKSIPHTNHTPAPWVRSDAASTATTVAHVFNPNRSTIKDSRF